LASALHLKHISTSEPVHFLVSLPEAVFTQRHTWFVPQFRQDPSNATPVKHLDLIALVKEAKVSEKLAEYPPSSVAHVWEGN